VKEEVFHPQAPQHPAGPPPMPARSAPVNNFQYLTRSAPPPPPYRTNARPAQPPPPLPSTPSQPPVVTGPPTPPPPQLPTRIPVQRLDVAKSQGWLFLKPCTGWY
jgi:hypothetical protein